MRLNQLTKHFCHSNLGICKTCILNASTVSSGVEKLWPLILFFTYGNKKRSFGAKSGLYCGWLIKSMFWVLKHAVVWSDVWELTLSFWRVIRFRRFVFLISWQATGKQMVVYHTELAVLHCSSGTIATCPVFTKKYKRSFAWKCCVREQLLLDLAHLETSMHSTRCISAVNCILLI